MKRPAKKLLTCALVVVYLFVAMAPVIAQPVANLQEIAPENNSRFSDVGSQNQNRLFIDYLAQREILKGYPDGSYHPVEGLTRAEVAVLIARVLDLKPITGVNSRFKDVAPSHWGYGYILAAEKAGLVNGYADGSFRPNAKISRAEGVALFLRLSQAAQLEAVLPVLEDVKEVLWAAKEIAIALDSGMVGLSADKKKFLPEQVLTRGDAARALAILLTHEPELSKQELKGKLAALKGQVFLTRAGVTNPIKEEKLEVKAGDLIEIGSNGEAELTFPDGTGILLKENTKLDLKELAGRAYIKENGDPGTAVEWLALELKVGEIFGALATSAQASAKFASIQAVTPKPVSQQASKEPWWRSFFKKRTKVKVEMGWSIAGIQGTNWKNKVYPGGRSNTTLLTGNAEVEAGGKTVPLAAGQRTEVRGKELPPTPAEQMRAGELREWLEVQQWVRKRAEEINENKEAVEPPPAAAEPDPSPEPDPISLVDDALDSAKNSVETVSGGSGGGSGTTPADRTPPTLVSTEPVYGSLTVPVDQIIDLKFSEPVKLAAGSNNIILLNAKDLETSLEFSLNVLENRLQLDPGSLEYDSAYSLTIPAGTISDLAGNKITEELGLKFSTQARVSVNTITKASVSQEGYELQSPSSLSEVRSISADGQLIVFESDEKIYLRDLAKNQTQQLNVDITGQPGVFARESSISADGRYVAFSSHESNLVPDDTNNKSDIFVREVATGKIVRVSFAVDGTSDFVELDGEGNLGAIYPSLSADGRFVTFISDDSRLTTSGLREIFVRDRDTDKNGIFDEIGGVSTKRVTVSLTGSSPNGSSAHPVISGNGRFVAFYSEATNLVRGVSEPRGYIRDLQTNTTSVLANSSSTAFSADGRYLVYSEADESGLYDIFLLDRDPDQNGIFDEGSQQAVKITASYMGSAADGGSYLPSISVDGKLIAFISDASNLVANDTNGLLDVFVYEVATGLTSRVNLGKNGVEADGDSWYPVISADGGFVAFVSDAGNLVSNDSNEVSDVFVAELNLN